MAAESQNHHQILLHHHHQQEPPQQPPPSRGLRSTAGQIVEVQGGHIVRSTGRKDRHSKVCTAKGPRDRRVRLSAHTAIQFYDVQDRLGYDRPSKAVDWLIKNAKAAIDELAKLPAWHPAATLVNTDNQENHGGGGEISNRDTQHLVAEHGNSSNYHEFGGGSSSFLPPSLDSDAIADTIKSFFPIATAMASSSAQSSSSSPIGFQSYPEPDLLSRISSQNQDLRLSLQSLQDPIFHHQQHQNSHQQHQNSAASHHHSLFSGFDSASMIPWEVAESSSGGGGGEGYIFNVQLQQQQQAAAVHHRLSHGHMHGQSQFFTQRGPLQSSNPPFVRAWADPMAAAADHQIQHHHPVIAIHHPIGFASGGSSGFSGFRIPARIQGQEEENKGKPSSASSGSHH